MIKIILHNYKIANKQNMFHHLMETELLYKSYEILQILLLKTK